MSSALTLDEQLQLEALSAEAARRVTCRFQTWFPSVGPFSRDKYPKHLDFFAAGHTKERLFMAANRVGKSEAGAYEVTCHLTGLYPSWWQGRRFDGPVEVWAVGTNSQTTRDIVQSKLLGSVHEPGAGMIPSHLIERTITARGLAGALEGAQVRHTTGGTSLLGLKSYEQGRQSFEGTAKHVIWCDEEPPADCYTEMLYRTVTTKGIVMVTFTPLQGMSEVVKGFLEPETPESAEFKTFVQAGWKDVPHLDEAEQRALIATTPPYQIAARRQRDTVLDTGLHALGRNSPRLRREVDLIPGGEQRLRGPRGAQDRQLEAESHELTRVGRAEGVEEGGHLRIRQGRMMGRGRAEVILRSMPA